MGGSSSKKKESTSAAAAAPAPAPAPAADAAAAAASVAHPFAAAPAKGTVLSEPGMGGNSASLAMPPAYSSLSPSSSPSAPSVPPRPLSEAEKQLVGMGFSLERVREALEKAGGRPEV